jgi:hypothetical protein
MHKSATKCNETLGKWCKNKHRASKIMDTLETYQPPRHPFFIDKNQVTFENTIFLLLHALCIFLGSVGCFCFQFSFALFAAINVWITSCVWRETCSIFHLPRTLYFSLLSFNECSLFLLLRLACIFCLDFCSNLVISLHQGVFWPLVHVGIRQKSFLKKVWMVLEKRKSFMQKKWYKKELV